MLSGCIKVLFSCCLVAFSQHFESQLVYLRSSVKRASKGGSKRQRAKDLLDERVNYHLRLYHLLHELRQHAYPTVSTVAFTVTDLAGSATCPHTVAGEQALDKPVPLTKRDRDGLIDKYCWGDSTIRKFYATIVRQFKAQVLVELDASELLTAAADTDTQSEPDVDEIHAAEHTQSLSMDDIAGELVEEQDHLPDPTAPALGDAVDMSKRAYQSTAALSGEK